MSLRVLVFRAFMFQGVRVLGVHMLFGFVVPAFAVFSRHSKNKRIRLNFMDRISFKSRGECTFV